MKRKIFKPFFILGSIILCVTLSEKTKAMDQNDEHLSKISPRARQLCWSCNVVDLEHHKDIKAEHYCQTKTQDCIKCSEILAEIEHHPRKISEETKDNQSKK